MHYLAHYLQNKRKCYSANEYLSGIILLFIYSSLITDTVFKNMNLVYFCHLFCSLFIFIKPVNRIPLFLFKTSLKLKSGILLTGLKVLLKMKPALEQIGKFKKITVLKNCHNSFVKLCRVVCKLLFVVSPQQWM